MKKLQNYLYQQSALYLKLIVVALPVGLSVLASSNVFAQDTSQETSSNEDDEDGDNEEVDGFGIEVDGFDDEILNMNDITMRMVHKVLSSALSTIISLSQM